jgi:hypothetical protein
VSDPIGSAYPGAVIEPHVDAGNFPVVMPVKNVPVAVEVIGKRELERMALVEAVVGETHSIKPGRRD